MTAENISERIDRTSLANFAVVMAVLLVMPLGVVSAAPAVSGEKEYEIPLSELNKVKKKTPSKRATNEYKKKKGDAKSEGTSSATASPNETAGQTTTSPDESNTTRINHVPYSFIVTGKRTLIHAVIDSKGDMREVNCTLQTTEGAAETLVKMEKVDGTRFTYKALLPALPPENLSLRYTIIAVDSTGKETRSREFVSPVTLSPLVPSWQSERAEDALPVDTGKN